MNDINNDNSITPRVMIAAAGSGSGKTVTTCGLLQILKDRGLNPVSFKCGPDYIDPMFHRTVLGIDSHNLDTFLAGPDGVGEVFLRAVSQYNVAPEEESRGNSSSDGHRTGCAVIEGVMGIYDGTSPLSLEGSCYEIAEITQTPIVLVVNAQGVGRTVISVIKGILSDDRSQLIKGLILNRMSDSFYDKLLPQLREEVSKIREDVMILGHIPKSDGFTLDSRHLGLKLPGEIDDLKEKIAHIASVIESNCDVGALVSLMLADKTVPSKTRSRSCSGVADARLVENLAKRRRPHRVFSETLYRSLDKTLAIARDEAFCFYYPENLQLLEELGAKLVYFSPIHDANIPDGADAILLGGGYPELYLEELSANRSMLDSIRSAIGKGMPSIAECGGFMYLHRVIEDKSGKPYEMVGVIDGECRYTGHLVNFGYTEITAVNEDVPDDFREALTGMRGHEFHYYESSAPGASATLCKPSTARTYTGMYIDRNRLWGWPHLYYPSLNRWKM